MGVLIPLVQAVIVGLFALAGIVVTQSWTSRRDCAKRRLELAEKVLALFYEAREAIAYIRNPAGFGGEGSTRQRQENETEEESGTLDRAFVVKERYRNQETVFNNLRTKKFRFMATFRDRTNLPFEQISTVVSKIFAASHMLGTYYWRRGERTGWTADERADHLRALHEQEAIFWIMSENDPIMAAVDEAVQKIEEIAATAATEYATSLSDWWQSWHRRATGGSRFSTLAVYMIIMAMLCIDLGFLVSLLKEPDYAHPAGFGAVVVGMLNWLMFTVLSTALGSRAAKTLWVGLIVGVISLVAIAILVAMLGRR